MSVIFIDLNNDPSGNFSTCLHRSDQKIREVSTSCCGGKKMVVEFKCEERNIFPVTPEICSRCKVYKSK